MITFQNSNLYLKALNIQEKIKKALKDVKTDFLSTRIHQASLDFAASVAVALNKQDKQERELEFKKVYDQAIVLYHFLLLSEKEKLVKDNSVSEKILTDLRKFIEIITNFEKHQKRILILSSIYGHGHMSVAKAIKEALEVQYGCDYQIEIVDFVEKIGSLFNKASVNLYEGSTKFIPSFYQFFYESTDTKWQIRFLNIINYPLNAIKIEKMFVEKNPDLIISTFPIWDYLAHLVWKRTGNKTAKFLSVVTDSISIHHAWVSGKPDFHIVANEDTATSLKKLGVTEEKIKTLGFPVKLEFLEKSEDKESFLKNLGLKSKNFTVLFLPTVENSKKTIQNIHEILNIDKDINLIVVAGRNYELKPKLDKAISAENVKIIGWTDQMPEFIKNSDVVITKAGGVTVMECIVAEKPIIINKIIPGQEKGNADLVKNYALGIVVPETDMSITEAIALIRKNYSFYKKNLHKISNPKASLKIAEFIHSLLK